MQWIFGSLRLRAAFFWLQVFSTSQAFSQPAQNPLTQTVGLPLREIMKNDNKLIVFLDTSVLLRAFASYRRNRDELCHNHGEVEFELELPLFLNDQETKRFTFEKCIYEAYMAFRGIGGKKPSEGRGDWAPRHLTNEDDPKTLNNLANRFHDRDMAFAFFWANHIDGINPENYADIAFNDTNSDRAKEFRKYLDDLSELKNQRNLFEILCDDFREMLEKEGKVIVLSYMDIFSDDYTWASNLGIELALDSYTLDSFVRNTAIPSEDFENVFAASRIFTDIFLTDDDKLTKCAWSLGVNSPLSPAAFCRSEEYESKKQEYKSGSVVAKSQDKK